MLQWIFSFGVTAVSVILCYCLYLSRRNQPFVTLINKIPGPKPGLFFGNILPYFTTPHEDWLYLSIRQLKEFVDRPLCRFWLINHAIIFVNDPQAIQTVMNSNEFLDKTKFYEFLHPWLGLGLLTSSGEKWRLRRKLITPAFHFGILDEFLKVQVEKANDLVNTLDTLTGGDYFDIVPYLSRHTLEVICETAMGISIHEQTDKNLKYVEALHGLALITKLRIMFPWLAPDSIFNLTTYSRLQKKYLKVLHGFTNQVIKERWEELLVQPKDKDSQPSECDKDHFTGRKKKVAFLDMLLEIYRDTQNLTFKDIREEVDTFMLGGHDTASVALPWILYNIGLYPSIQQRLHEEVNALFGNSKRSLTKEDLKEMKYLDLVIKESLRMFPPVPIIGRKSVGNSELCGYTIPADTTLVFHIYMIHRNEKYFPDSERFDPDRFLPENCVNRHPYAYIPFSAGSRNCIGQKFAMMELKTTVCEMLRNFKMTSKHRIDEMKITPEFVLRPVSGIWFKLERREII